MKVVLKLLVLTVIFLASGCASMRELPKNYWRDGLSDNTRLEAVYVSTSEAELVVETSIDAINGFKLVSKEPIKVPVGKNTFTVTCVGTNNTRTSQVEYLIRKNKKHFIQGLSNNEGDCFVMIIYQ